ncbi:sulfatase [bacterium]|nr:sulfatase [bacterium]
MKTTGAGALTLPLLTGSRLQSENMLIRPVTGKVRNIILILADDHRYDFMGFMGKPAFLETPALDRMARQGAHITNATVTTSLCSPSRASILTGLYSHRHGVVDNQAPLPEGLIFFPQYLQAAGYQTAMMGKWHMGDADDAPKPGFDKWVSFRGQGDYYNPLINVDGEAKKVKGYMTDILTDYALEWLRTERDPEKPFFMYLSHKAVHAMFKPAERHLGKYDDAVIEYPDSMQDTDEAYRGKPRWVRAQRDSWHGVDYMYHGAMDFDTFYRRYCETLLAVDESVGSVFQYLEDQDMLNETLILYLGDNGFCFGEHGLIDKRHMYEASMRIPMLVHCPDLVKGGREIPQLVQNIDIAPTLCEAAGLEPPGHMDGISFMPLLENRDIQWRDAVFYEYYWEWNFPQTPTTFGIRTDRYKYIHYHGIWDIDELYDLHNDPAEMQNLIQSPEHQNLIQSLKARMYAWLEKSGGMTVPLKRDQGFRGANRGSESG